MKPTTLGILLVCGAAALAGGWYFGSATRPAEQTSIASGGLMFPDLAGRLGTVTKVEITHQGKTETIEKRPDGQWGVASMHDYPVQETKLRGLLTGLTELRLQEPRTSNPSEYGRLGVDDPNGKDSSANLLRLVDASGKPILALIVGHHRVRSQGSGAEEVYVRRPDEAQSWLATGSISADADPALWLDRTIVNIGHDRIASVDVEDHALTFGQTDGKLALTAPPEHPKLEDYKVEDVGRALELLTFETVKADSDLQAPEARHAVFTTKDGLAVTARVFHVDKDVWARFSAEGSGEAKAEADKLNQHLAGWTYRLGSWKEKALVPTLDDLKAAEPQKPAAKAEDAPAETEGK